MIRQRSSHSFRDRPGPPGYVGNRVQFSRSLRTLSLLVLTIMSSAAAQVVDTGQYVNVQPLPDTTVTIRPVFGLNPDEFMLGAYVNVRPPTGGLGGIWPWADSLGISIIEDRHSLEYGAEIDSLADGARGTTSGAWRHRLIVHTPPISLLGWAREVIFYPFDTAASYYFQCRFLESWRSQGVERLNRDPSQRSPSGSPLRERVFDVSNTDTMAVVASRIAFGYDSAFHKRRWSAYPYDDSVEVTDEFYRRNDLDVSRDKASIFIVVTGHLFSPAEGGRPYDSAQDDIVLEIDIMNEVPEGATFMNADGATMRATADTTFLYTTLYLSKRQFLPLLAGADTAYDRYRAAEFWIDMKRMFPFGPGGPFNDANSAHRMDVRVRWTGKEKLALRSVALRDTMAQLLLGNRTHQALFRAAIIDSVERALRGYSWSVQDQRLAASTRYRDRLGKIIRFYTGDEGTALRNVGFNWLDSTLYRRFANGDSSTRGLRAYRAQATILDSDAPIMTSQNEITVETYPWDFWHMKGEWSDPAASSRVGESRGGWMGDMAGWFGLPDSIQQPPSIVEHNGGRFYIPQLGLDDRDARSNVELYTHSIQRLAWGAYVPFRLRWPYSRWQLTALGRAADVSRRTGRRIILWTGVHTTLHIWNREKGGRTYRDTLIGHIPEASEIRANVNIGLAYGIRGIQYSYLGANVNEYYGRDFIADFGPVGATTADTQNVVDYRLRSPWYISPEFGDSISQFYTGWGTRLREIRWVNRTWIPRIWPHLRRLRWRDAYSVHFTTPQDYAAGSTRPFESTEIVQAVQARDREGRVDSPSETYVEVGLFESRKGASPSTDTAWVMVVNRRTFERPDDVPPTSRRGRLMDSLAEWRLVTVRLHLPPVDGQPTRIARVREVGHDPVNLPGLPGERAPVDTTVSLDSAFNVWIRPGGGSLFEITYQLPNGRLNDLHEPDQPRSPGGHGFASLVPSRSPESSLLIVDRAPLPARAPLADRSSHDLSDIDECEPRTP